MSKGATRLRIFSPTWRQYYSSVSSISEHVVEWTEVTISKGTVKHQEQHFLNIYF